MKSQKGISFLAIIIVVAFVAIMGSAGYFAYKQYFAPKPIACTLEAKICPDGSSVGRTGPNCEFAQCPEISDQTAGWKTYTSDEYGFEFKYPKSGYISKNEGNNFLAWVPSFWPPKVKVISIDKDPVEEGCNISKYYQQFVNQKDSWIFLSKYTFDNINYDLYIKKYRGTKSGEFSHCYITEKNGKYYVIYSLRTSTVDSDFDLEEDVSSLMQKIISTFKFAK